MLRVLLGIMVVVKKGLKLGMILFSIQWILIGIVIIVTIPRIVQLVMASSTAFHQNAVTQTSGMKAHYLCTKAECLQELARHGTKPRSDLTVPELRVLLREVRRKMGLLPDAKPSSIMDEIKKGTKEELKNMCAAREVPFGSRATVGELRLALRQWLVESGTAETVITFGRHQGATFGEVAVTAPSYLEWAKGVVQEESEPEWRLLQLAKWAAKVANQPELWQEEKPYVPPETAQGIKESMNQETLGRVARGYQTQPSEAAPKPGVTHESMMLREAIEKMHAQIVTMGKEIQDLRQENKVLLAEKARKTTTHTESSFDMVTEMEFQRMAALDEVDPLGR